MDNFFANGWQTQHDAQFSFFLRLERPGMTHFNKQGVCTLFPLKFSYFFLETFRKQLRNLCCLVAIQWRHFWHKVVYEGPNVNIFGLFDKISIHEHVSIFFPCVVTRIVFELVDEIHYPHYGECAKCEKSKQTNSFSWGCDSFLGGVRPSDLALIYVLHISLVARKSQMIMQGLNAFIVVFVSKRGCRCPRRWKLAYQRPYSDWRVCVRTGNLRWNWGTWFWCLCTLFLGKRQCPRILGLFSAQ